MHCRFWNLYLNKEIAALVVIKSINLTIFSLFQSGVIYKIISFFYKTNSHKHETQVQGITWVNLVQLYVLIIDMLKLEEGLGLLIPITVTN